jgi:hypothetical protein
MSDSLELAKLLRADEQPNLTHKLALARSGTIYFGELDTYDDDDHVQTSAPMIARKSAGKWQGIRIDDTRLKNAAWSFVGAGPNRGEIWGALDQSVEDSKDLQADVLVAHSTDGGKTFRLIALHKPEASATFDSLCIGPDGHGRLTMYLPGDDEAIARPGFYHFRTSDFGRSWQTPRYEADALSAAHDVGDDEQPDVAGPVHSASFTHK